ncbi:Programmed cell death protein 2-like [Linum perenne]
MDKVLLGMPGPWAKDNREQADHYTTKIGGLPDWPFARESLAPDTVKCAKCGCQLCLVAQVYAPVSAGALKIEERLLLIFGCIMPGCETSSDSWRALRVQKLDDGGAMSMNNGKAVPSTTPSVSDSKTSWFDDLDDEDDEDIDLEALGRAFLEAGAALASSSKKECKKKRSGAGPSSLPLTPGTRVVDKETPVAPCFYLYTREFKSASAVDSVSSNYSSLSIKEKQYTDGEDSDKETWAPEAYEYDSALNADRTYLKFKKQLDANPDQCFRYSYGGKALLAAQEVTDAGRCKLCGGSRSYEMQLMPTVIYFLQEAADDHLRRTLENWDWLTLLLYTCAKFACQSCSNASSTVDGWIVAEEIVILQSENTKVISQLSQFQ